MSFTAAELEERRNTLGASEIAAVCGLNPWKSAHQVWLSKMGLVEETETHATRLGTLIEPVLRQLYSEDTGHQLASFGTIVHPRHPWMSATPDAAVFGKPRLVELKMVGWRSAHHWTEEADGIPDYYRPQCEWQAECCGAEGVDMVALIGGTDFRVYRIDRDPELAEMLRGIGEKFWRDHVVARVAPRVDGSEGAREMLQRLYPRHVSALKPAPPEVVTLGEQLAVARAEAKAAEAAKDLAENRMREAIADGEGFFADTFKVTWKTTKAGTRPLKFTPKGEAA